METIVCAGLLEKEGKFLLVKAKIGTPKGLWNMPGGHKEEQESHQECVQREVEEETGFIVEPQLLIGVYTHLNTKKYIYATKILGGKLKIPSDEIEETQWFTLGEIQKLKKITASTVPAVLDYQKKKFNQEHQCTCIP